MIRRTPTSKRQLRRALTLKSAAEQIGHLSPSIELFGVSKSFSLIDAIEHLLTETGPAHVILATWSAANADLAHAHGLLTNGAILSFRLVTDLFDFQAPGEGFSKKPGELCKDFARFGQEGAPADETITMQSTDTAKYCGTGTYDRDINRPGLTYMR